MKKLLFNTAHPLSESGKPIFIPFGEWKYDGATRQRLDRAHGEKIANELNARVAKGEPGIPVYQGHPDVPELAAKYPDKGALGWVTHIELVNEDPTNYQLPTNQLPTNQLPAKSGLALTVEWDRDPGKGFKWFSPYWMANERDGSTYVVDSIASIGLVNNPNIPEFRLANSVDANGMEHVEAGVPEGGQFAGHSEASNVAAVKSAATRKGNELKKWMAKGLVPNATIINRALEAQRSSVSGALSGWRTRNKEYTTMRRKNELGWVDRQHSTFQAKQAFMVRNRELAAIHRTAILSGLKWNAKTKSYE